MPLYTRRGFYTNKTVRIDDKVVIVTGANCGIGKFTATELAKRGGKIYLACRNEEKGTKAMKEIKVISGNDKVHFLRLDLASLASVREFSEKFHTLESGLDILVNNGGLLSPEARTDDGFEMNMGVNHLGHFLLTNLLLDLLKKSSPSRVVVVSSDLHRIGTIHKENLNSEKSFPGVWLGYSNSKLANVLFASELAKQLEGSGVTVNSCCPGPVQTDVNKNLNAFSRFLMYPFVKVFYRTIEHGSQTQIMLALEPEVEKVTGKYFGNCEEKEASAKGRDVDMRQWLWKQSEVLTKLNEKL